MSFRARGIAAVVITGFLSMWIGWASHARVQDGATVGVIGMLLGLGLVAVGSWIAFSSAQSGYASRIQDLAEHLRQVQEQGNYSARHGLDGADPVAQVARHVDAILDVVVRRSDEFKQQSAVLEKALVDGKNEQADLRKRLGDEIHQRQRSEEGLRKAQADFEQRVRERTEELSASNDALVEATDGPPSWAPRAAACSVKCPWPSLI